MYARISLLIVLIISASLSLLSAINDDFFGSYTIALFVWLYATASLAMCIYHYRKVRELKIFNKTKVYCVSVAILFFTLLFGYDLRLLVTGILITLAAAYLVQKQAAIKSLGTS